MYNMYMSWTVERRYLATRIHLVKKERFDEFMKHIYKVPGTNKQIIKKFARIGEASIIYSIGRHRFTHSIHLLPAHITALSKVLQVV